MASGKSGPSTVRGGQGQDSTNGINPGTKGLEPATVIQLDALELLAALEAVVPAVVAEDLAAHIGGGVA